MGFMDELKGIGASASLAGLGKQLMDHGVETPAHIDTMQATGKSDTPGGHEHIVTATVHPPGGEPYTATFDQFIYPQAPFAGGEDVIVRVDPDDPTAMMLWSKR